MNDSPTLAEVLGLDAIRLAGLVETLRQRSVTVATAESLTAGLVCAALTEVPGSSAVVRGGLVVYATELKHTLAAVPTGLLEHTGPVHPRVAAALATGARQRCGATVGLGSTGVAGPDPQDGRPVGTVHLACATPEGTTRTTLRLDPTSSRGTIRAAAVRSALALLAASVGAEPPETDGTGAAGVVSPTADIGVNSRAVPRE